MSRAAWIVTAIVTAVRALAAFRVPLTGDEAYYWEWSRRLAFGYSDHPPGVAFTIAAFSWLGPNAGFVRLGFVVCGLLATIALARTATLLAGDERAGTAAALLFSLAPLCSVAFASATPDGPYLLFWCLALYAAALAFRSARSELWLALGAATGGALLSRLFALALPAGFLIHAVALRSRSLLRGCVLALAVAAAVFSPFLFWNSANGWVTFAFTFVHRQEQSTAGFSLGRPAALLGAQLFAYSPGIWAAALVAAVRPQRALLAWTALPLFLLLYAFALFVPVEVYWFLGPFASLCALAGIAFAGMPAPARLLWKRWTLAPAAVMLTVLIASALFPGPIYLALVSTTGLKLRNSGPFEVFTYAPLAREVARLTGRRHAIAMTDGYGFSSVLDYEGGVTPVVIGYDWQGRESKRWYSSDMQPVRALFVDKEPLASRPDINARLERACGRVTDGGRLSYGSSAFPPRVYYLTWCEAMVPGALRILRWEGPA